MKTETKDLLTAVFIIGALLLMQEIGQWLY